MSSKIKQKSINTDKKLTPVTLESKTKNDILSIFHISDVHIERNERREKEYCQVFTNLNRILEKEIDKEKNQDLIVLTGDLIDFKNHVTNYGIYILIKFLRMLSSQAPVILVAGNHDSNTSDPNCKDLIDCICPYINSVNPIFYLKQSNAYKYNNIIFSVSSIYDRKIIKKSEIEKSKNDKVVFLHHGFVLDKKDPLYAVIRFKDHLTPDQLNSFDICMLGDIHDHHFIRKNMAYSGSLIQRSHKEKPNSQGFIKWDLINDNHKFIHVPNEYGYVTVELQDNKLKDLKMDEIKKIFPKNTRIKIKYSESTDKTTIKKILEEIKEKGISLEEIRTERIFNGKDIGIDLIEPEDINKIDPSSQETIDKMMDKYFKDIKKLDKDKDTDFINKIKEVHNKYFKEIDKSNQTNGQLTLLSMSFDNIYSYGENNNIVFYDNKPCVMGLTGPNKNGKSAIPDGICYLLFDKTIRNSGSVKYDILNVNKNKFRIEMILKIDNKVYKIVKSGEKNKNKDKNLTRRAEIYIRTKKDYKLIHNWDLNDTNGKIAEFLGITYNDFLFSCVMPQYNPREILNLPNKERKKIISRYLKIDYFDKIYKQVDDDLKELSQKGEDLTEKIKEDEIDINKTEISKNEYNKKIEEKKNLERKIKVQQKKLEKVRNSIINIDDAYLSIDELNDEIKELKNENIEAEKHIKQLNKNVATLKEEMYNVMCPKDDLTELKELGTKEVLTNIKDSSNKYKNNKTLKDVITSLNNHVGSFEEKYIEIVTKNIDDIKSKNDEIQNILTIIEEKKIEIVNNNNEIKNRTEQKKKVVKYDNIKKQNEINQEKAKKLKKEIEDIEDEIDGLDKTIEEYKEQTIENKVLQKQQIKWSKDLDKINEEIKLLEFYKDMTHFDGIPKMMMMMMIDILEDSMNNILQRFSDLKCRLMITQKKESHIDIFLVDKNNIYNACNNSGFEMLAFNLAFKIALSRMSLLKMPKILILDEALACIDTDGIDKIDKLFDYIKEIFTYTLVITHDETIKDKVDNTIEVKRNKNGFSKLLN